LMVRRRRRRRRATERNSIAKAVMRLGDVPTASWAIGADEILLSRGRTQLSVSKLPNLPKQRGWLDDIELLQRVLEKSLFGTEGGDRYAGGGGAAAACYFACCQFAHRMVILRRHFAPTQLDAKTHTLLLAFASSSLSLPPRFLLLSPRFLLAFSSFPPSARPRPTRRQK
jgi:hypothetical protein